MSGPAEEQSGAERAELAGRDSAERKSAERDSTERDSAEEGGFGHLLIERSGGIGGFLLVWDIDVDASRHREEIGPRIAALPWESESGSNESEAGPNEAEAGGSAEAGGGSHAGGGADRFVYLIESRFGYVRFGESRMPEDFRRLVDSVREIADPERRRP
ncbi:hypothetical protein ACH82I_14460 [Brevibacterium sp. GP-SGM9]|uniref:hypothetical protein n=1 Tax=unclassified Brevibacterium TaxID=2614124 RepID=UPI001E3159C3|nr:MULTISPECIES: hypothetical protein [unclassified Brevibacterium]MCD1285388.1 hypothetical protein [Brevibacterium sp. CCUG 69071]MDK8434437.1 hypothetical protein [Brevibacterium sp. H-BE7]